MNISQTKKYALALALLFSAVIPLTTAAQGTATVQSNQATPCDPTKDYASNTPCYSIKNPTSYTPLAPIPTCTGTGCSNSVNTSVNFQGYIQNTFNFAIFVAAAAAVFMITFGGFQYMTTDSVQGKTDGRKKAVNAVYGLLLVLGSYLILRTIDPRLVAIPSTLVTPLNINYTNSNNDFLSALGATINQYHSNTQDALAAIAAGKALAAQIQTSLSSADSQICNLSPGSPTLTGTCSDTDAQNICDSASASLSTLPDAAGLNQACATRADLLNQAQANNQNTALATAIGLATGGAFLESCNPLGNPSLCDPTQAMDLYYQYGGQISPDQLPKLQSAVLYEQDVFQMTQQVATLYQNASSGLLGGLLHIGGALSVSSPTGTPSVYQQYQSTLKSITDTANAYASSANADPKLVAQMKVQQDALTKTINAMTYH